MLYCIQSNRLERLFEKLCLVLAESTSDPLQPMEIVVQNPGMGKWISQQMACKSGIAANLYFPLPARFIWEILASQLLLDDERRIFDRTVLQFRILKEFSCPLPEQSFAEITQYMLDDHDGCKAFQLAGRIADLFDQYLVYRPDVLLEWESGKGSGWQALLWQKLTASTQEHRARYIKQFLDKAHNGEIDKTLLPSQVFIFGISSLAPVYLEVIHAISAVVDVYLFHMNPCRDYWAEIASDAEVARARKNSCQEQAAAGEDYFFRGNPLLASLGKVGREFVRHSQDLVMVEQKEYQEPQEGSMLASLQRDILDLVDRSDPSVEKVVTSRGDRSVQMHSCHSRLREVQVLHDRLLEMFEQEPGLTPGDILVMAPAIEEYTSAIRSVFSGMQANLFIPWSMADRSIRGEAPLADVFLSLFELCRSRFAAPEVVSFLETRAVMRRFQIDEEGLATIRKWIGESGIRWGLDTPHQQEFSPSMDNGNSWNFGMDRLFMSYFTGDLATVVHAISPVGPLNGSLAELLGRFATFLGYLRGTRKDLLNERSPADWGAFLLELLDRFFDPGNSEEDEQALLRLRETICTFDDNAQLACFTRPLKVSVIHTYLRDALSIASQGQAFLSGRVTFCNMVPMRSIPFEVICLLGMNDTDYPRKQNVTGFDLMARHPRPGDRNRRDDDRYLFLEALLSARRFFYVSWRGRDQLDNSIRPPSVVVSELHDYMERSFVDTSGNSLEQMVIEHPLQPFSSRCFDGTPETSSFAVQWLPTGEGQESKVFVADDLPEPSEEWRTVDLKQLVQFWSHPVRYFLQQRLAMNVYEDDELLEESEVFQPDHLERYLLTDRFVKAKLRDHESEVSFLQLRAEGVLPHGSIGWNYYEDLIAEAEAVIPALVPYINHPQEPLEVDLPVSDFHIKGWLDGLYDYGCVRFRPAKIKGRDLVKLWIEHLVYNALHSGRTTCRSIHVASDQKGEFQPVDNPENVLSKLLELYWQGLCSPLHFFPETSRAWMNDGRESRSDTKAAMEWNGGFRKRGEREGLEYRIALQGKEAPLGENFKQLAEAVYKPLFEHLELSNA